MRLKTILLPLMTSAVAVSAAIPCPPGDIIFFAQPNFQGESATVAIEYGKVLKVPDYNKLGDRGSSWKITGASYCKPWEGEHGDGWPIGFIDHADEGIDGWFYSNSDMQFPHPNEEAKMRSVVCKSFHAINGACQYKPGPKSRAV